MNTALLTPTEELICKYKCMGLQRKEIAEKLHNKANTLITHFKNIHAKLHINNDSELVVWYIENIMKIEIRKMLQVSVLLALLVPSIISVDNSMIRTRSASRTIRTARTRRSEGETDYLLVP